MSAAAPPTRDQYGNYFAGGPFAREAMSERTGLIAQGVAQRLAQYGPQGQAWANRLMQDPQAGLALMDQYGGPQQVEFALANAASQGREATADNILRMLGPEAFAEWAKAQSDLQSAAPGLSEASARWIGGRGEGMYKDFNIQRSFFEAAMAAARKAAASGSQEDMGAADFALVQAMGKLIDPNSVVRNEEGKFIQEAGESNLGALLHDFKRWTGQTGVMSSKARLALIDQIETIYRQAEKSYGRKYGQFSDYVGGMQWKDPSFAQIPMMGWQDPTTLPDLDFDAMRKQYAEAAGRLDEAEEAGANTTALPERLTRGELMEKARALKPGESFPYGSWIYSKAADGTFRKTRRD